MTTIKEQIARHTRSEVTPQQQPQQLPDDPLAPKPIRFPQQQARVTQAYPLTTRMPTSQIPAHHAAVSATSTRGPRSTGGRRCYPLPRSSCAASASPGTLPVHRNTLPGEAGSTGQCTW